MRKIPLCAKPVVCLPNHDKVISMSPSTGDPGSFGSASCHVPLIHIYGPGKLLHFAISGKQHMWVRVAGRSIQSQRWPEVGARCRDTIKIAVCVRVCVRSLMHANVPT